MLGERDARFGDVGGDRPRRAGAHLLDRPAGVVVPAELELERAQCLQRVAPQLGLAGCHGGGGDGLLERLEGELGLRAEHERAGQVEQPGGAVGAGVVEGLAREAQVALVLRPAREMRLDVATVQQPQLRSGGAHRRLAVLAAQHLLVQAPDEVARLASEDAQRREGAATAETVALEQLDRRQHRLHVRRGGGEVAPEHGEVAVHALVGVEPEDPRAMAGRERGVTRPGEVVVPVALDHGRAVRPGDGDRRVARPGVVDDELVGELVRRVEGEGDLVLLVLGDHAQRDEGSAPAAGRPSGPVGASLRGEVESCAAIPHPTTRAANR